MATELTMLSQNAPLVFDAMLAMSQVVNHESFNYLLYAAALIGFLGFVVSRTFQMKEGTTLQTFMLSLFVIWIATQITTKLAIEDPVTGDVYMVEKAPLGIALVGWSSSALAQGIITLYSQFFTTPNSGEALGKNQGVGRALAIIQGTQDVPWSAKSRLANGDASKHNDLEKSISNYLTQCYVPNMLAYGGQKGGFAAFHQASGSPGISNLWNKVKTEMNLTTDLLINSETPEGDPEMCGIAHGRILTALTSDEYKYATSGDAIHHMARNMAATQLPGRMANLNAGGMQTTPQAIETKMRGLAAQTFQQIFGGATDIYTIVTMDRLNRQLLAAMDSLPQGVNTDNIGRFSTALHDAQRQQQLSMAAQGDWFVRNAGPFTAFIEVLMYGFLPFMLLYMFISPKGMKAVIGIVGIYLWIQTWPIAHLLINYSVGVNFQTSIDVITRGDYSGMENIYALWDQVRHSYAISQSLLGMTPVLTGALLTGSMMMLTKLAGNMSSTENFDEKRLHRDTESASPLYATESINAIHHDADGNIVQTETRDGVSEEINAKSVQSHATAEAQKRSETDNKKLAQKLNETFKGNVQSLTTEQLQDVYGMSENVQTTFTSNLVSGSTKASQELQQISDKIASKVGIDASAAYQIAGAKDKAARGAIAAKYGVSAEQAENYMNQLSSTDEYKTALQESVQTTKDLGINKTAADIKSATTSFDKTITEGFDQELSTALASEQAYSDQKSLEDSISSDRKITEGQQWNIMGNVLNRMQEAGQRAGADKDARLAAKAQVAMEAGLTEEEANKFAKIHEDGLWKGSERRNSGGREVESGMLETMKNQGMNWRKFIVQNDPSTRGRFADVADIKPEDKTGVQGEDGELTYNTVDESRIPKDAKGAYGPTTLTPEMRALHLKRIEAAEKEVEEAEALKNYVESGNATNAMVLDSPEEGENLLANNATRSIRGISSAASEYGHQRRIERADWAQKTFLKQIEGAGGIAHDMLKSGATNEEINDAVYNHLSKILNADDQNTYNQLKEDGKSEEANAFVKELFEGFGLDGANYNDIANLGGNVDHGNYPRIKSGYDGLNLTELAGLKAKMALGMELSNHEMQKVAYANKNHSMAGFAEGGHYDVHKGFDVESNPTSIGYADKMARDHFAKGVFDHNMEALAGQRANGEVNYVDVIIAEAMAATEYIDYGTDLDKKITDFTALVSSKAYGGGLSGTSDASGRPIMGMKSLTTAIASELNGAEGAHGAALSESDIQEIFNEVFKDLNLDDLKAQIPSDLKARIDTMKQEFVQEKIVEQKEELGHQIKSDRDSFGTIRG